MSPVELSYCVVNTNGRADLLTGLEAIRRTHPAGLDAEILVLDNASDDGSSAAVREWAAGADLELPLRVIDRERRAGKAENDTLLMREARGRLCLLLNEDAELKPGATAELVAALDADPGAAAAGAQLLDAAERPLACAWRLPGVFASLASALFLHRWLVTQSGGEETREAGWVQSSAMLVRADAARDVGWLDPAFFVYSDETDFEKRLRDAGWRILYVPSALAIHHEQLANDRSSGERRLIEFHRNRDLYMRKHHGAAAAAVCRVLNAIPYLPRALASVFLPGRSPGLMALHARRALRPYGGGEGIREAAAAYNARLASGAVVRAEE
ncbi:glycosyltransferase [Thermoleophilia bacterium SCSIO 60948]|nr:glycosyltransferase [Thermoleophilia bacterium SCSIO 60948]